MPLTRHAWRFLGLSFVLLSVAANLTQSLWLAKLRAERDSIISRHQLIPGMTVPSLDAVRLDGTPVSLLHRPSETKTVLYWMSPGCSWCQANSSSFVSLAKQIRGRFTIVLLSPSSVGLGWLPEVQAADITVATPSAGTLSGYRLSGTPMTIVIDGDRKVLRVWNGAYTDENRVDLERYFNVRLQPAAPH